MDTPITEEQLVDLIQRKDESRQDILRNVFIAAIVIISFSTTLRLWPKKSGRKGFFVDDGLIVLASISAIGLCITGLAFVIPHGLGKHIVVLSEDDIRMFLMSHYIMDIFYGVTVGSAKLSVLAFYYYIFSTPKFRKIVIFSATFVTLSFCALVVSLILVCRPIKGYWDRRVDSNCFDRLAFIYSANIINLVTDAWIFLLPVPLVLRLRVTLAKKIALCAMFSVGLGVCVITAVRLNNTWPKISNDFTWDLVPLFILTTLEALASILCANLPMIYPEFLDTIRTLKRLTSKLSKNAPTKGSFSSTFSSFTFENGGRRAGSKREGRDSNSPITMTDITTTLGSSKAFDCESSPAIYNASATASSSSSPDQSQYHGHDYVP